MLIYYFEILRHMLTHVDLYNFMRAMDKTEQLVSKDIKERI